jgi:hypothetical protein
MLPNILANEAEVECVSGFRGMARISPMLRTGDVTYAIGTRPEFPRDGRFQLYLSLPDCAGGRWIAEHAAIGTVEALTARLARVAIVAGTYEALDASITSAIAHETAIQEACARRKAEDAERARKAADEKRERVEAFLAGAKGIKMARGTYVFRSADGALTGQTVPCEMAKGLAIYRSPNRPEAFTIGHVASGFRVTSVATKQGARAAVAFLASLADWTVAPIDATKEGPHGKAFCACWERLSECGILVR